MIFSLFALSHLQNSCFDRTLHAVAIATVDAIDYGGDGDGLDAGAAAVFVLVVAVLHRSLCFI